MGMYSNIEVLINYGSEGVSIALLAPNGKATVWTIKESDGVVSWRSGVSIVRSSWLVLDVPYFVDRRDSD